MQQTHNQQQPQNLKTIHINPHNQKSEISKHQNPENVTSQQTGNKHERIKPALTIASKL
jgi:5-methylcytosine-specific restriction endonuclease McrA